MPDTIIFTNGQPTKWLTTLADGRLARNVLSISSTYNPSSRHVRAKAPKMNEIMIHEQVKLVHDAFFKFRSTYEDFDDPVTAPLCIAWYTDGKKEVLQSQVRSTCPPPPSFAPSVNSDLKKAADVIKRYMQDEGAGAPRSVWAAIDVFEKYSKGEK